MSVSQMLWHMAYIHSELEGVNTMKKLLILFLFLLAVTPLFSQSQSLTWDANSESDLSGYNVYRSDPNNTTPTKVNPSLIACEANDVTCVFFTDDTIIYGISYSWVATAVNTTGNESGFSNTYAALVPNPGAPSAPGNLREFNTVSNRFYLDWDLVPEADRYEVFFSRKQQDNWYLGMFVTGPPTTEFQATGQRRWAKVRSSANDQVSIFSQIVALK